jgi:hypothetical protein
MFMKTVLFAAAILAGGAAIAQTSSGSTPERDARGIPVISAPATAPAGANQGVPATPGGQVVPAPNQQQVFATQPSSKEYPPCTRDMTDGCVQTYERGVRVRR